MNSLRRYVAHLILPCRVAALPDRSFVVGSSFVAAAVEGEEGFGTTSIFECGRRCGHYVRRRHLPTGPHPHPTQLRCCRRQTIQRYARDLRAVHPSFYMLMLRLLLPHAGIWQAFINIVRTEGPLATYKGVVATVLVRVVYSVCHHALGFTGDQPLTTHPTSRPSPTGYRAICRT